MTDRHYGMDWLRIGAFGLLIFYHIGMFFVPWDWHVKIAQPIDWARIPMLALNPWRLALLFAVSGYASAMLFGRRGNAGSFLASRSARLLIPLAFGMAIVVPPQSWVELMFKHGYAQGFAHFWLRDYFRFGTLDGIVLPTWNHLWFVVYLWTYSMLVGFALLIVPGHVRAAIARFSERMLAGPLILIVPMASLVLKDFVLLPDLEPTHALIGDWASHIVYLPVFLFGWLLARSDTLWVAIRAHWKIAGVLAIAAYAGVVAVIVAGEAMTRETASLLVDGLRIAQGWGAIIALIGLADRFLNRNHPARAMLTEAVFPFYIIHQTIIVLVAWWMIPAGFAPGVQFLLLVAATVAGCWLFYRIGREIPGFRLLIGLKGFQPPRRLRSVVDRAAEGLG